MQVTTNALGWLSPFDGRLLLIALFFLVLIGLASLGVKSERAKDVIGTVCMVGGAVLFIVSFLWALAASSSHQKELAEDIREQTNLTNVHIITPGESDFVAANEEGMAVKCALVPTEEADNKNTYDVLCDK